MAPGILLPPRRRKRRLLLLRTPRRLHRSLPSAFNPRRAAGLPLPIRLPRFHRGWGEGRGEGFVFPPVTHHSTLLPLPRPRPRPTPQPLRPRPRRKNRKRHPRPPPPRTPRPILHPNRGPTLPPPPAPPAQTRL